MTAVSDQQHRPQSRPSFFAVFLARKRPEVARKQHAQFIENWRLYGQNNGKGGDVMNKLVARLIDCGMTREIALFMMRQYKGRPRDFELYVESVEESNREQMETL